MTYPVKLEPAEDAVLMRLLDFSEIITFGEDSEDALRDDAYIRIYKEEYGTGKLIEYFVPSAAGDLSFVEWWGGRAFFDEPRICNRHDTRDLRDRCPRYSAVGASSDPSDPTYRRRRGNGFPGPTVYGRSDAGCPLRRTPWDRPARRNCCPYGGAGFGVGGAERGAGVEDSEGLGGGIGAQFCRAR